MHTFQVIFLAFAGFTFGIAAIIGRSLIALGLLAWLLAVLIPLLVS